MCCVINAVENKTGKKENLSEMEQQLKKAEAAQRRKVQIEKAARESEVDAFLSLYRRYEHLKYWQNS